MEDVLNVYHAPYDPGFPLICMDESNKQLVGEIHAPWRQLRVVMVAVAYRPWTARSYADPFYVATLFWT